MPRLTAYGAYNHFSEEKYKTTVTPLPPPLPTLTGNVLVQPSSSGNWGVRADQSFSLSARELDALKIAGQGITKSQYDLDSAKTDFILAVASSYYNVLRAQKALDIARANLERLAQYRHFVDKKVKVGELTRPPCCGPTANSPGPGPIFSLRAENALKLSRAALVRITGVPEPLELKEEDALPAYADDLDKMRTEAFDARADLKSFEMQTQMASQQVKYARGAFWPQVGLFAVYSGLDQSPETATLNKESLFAGVSLTFPFFEGGLRIAEYRETQAREGQARQAYDDMIKNIDIEMRADYLELETQKGTLKFLEDPACVRTVTTTTPCCAVMEKTRPGVGHQALTFMDANTLLLSSERNVADAIYGCRLAYLKVRKSSGTLLKFIGEEN